MSGRGGARPFTLAVWRSTEVVVFELLTDANAG